MKNTDYPVTAVASGCELFLRFITLAKLDTKVNSISYKQYRINYVDCKTISRAIAVRIIFVSNRRLGSVKASCYIVVSFS